MRLGSCVTALLAATLLLPGCGGSADEFNGRPSLRLVNLSDRIASLDLVSGDTLVVASVAAGQASPSAAVDAGEHDLELRGAGSATTAATASVTLEVDTAYTLLAYGSGATLRTLLLTDDEPTPAGGLARLRVANAASEAGAVDVYLTAPGTDLADAVPSLLALSDDAPSAYLGFAAGNWRIRVTGAGDKADLRLDLPAVALASQQVATLALSRSAGGVLVHAHLVDQQGAVRAHRNPSARLRLVAGAAGGAAASASSSGRPLLTALQSPSVGGYTLVDAGDHSIAVQLGSAELAPIAVMLEAGSDSTLLVTSRAGVGSAALIADDNRPPPSATHAKVRLLHGVGDLGSTMTLTADFLSLADNVAVGTASAPANVTPATGMRLEVTSPAAAEPLWLTTDLSLAAGSVYTLFVLGDAPAPLSVLRRER